MIRFGILMMMPLYHDMTESLDRRLFCFGFGYSARALARALAAEGWAVAGTYRGDESRDELIAAGFDDLCPFEDAGAALAGATHILSSVPPGAEGDPVLARHGAAIASTPGLEWLGYLSTTGVYGDTGGAAVDENSPCRPSSARAERRLAAEKAWRKLGAQVFRLAGIYGPGRNALLDVRAGRARRIDKPGHKFSRIHVEDIAGVLRASIARPEPGAVYNVCDDEPAEQAVVVEHACRLLGVEPPPLVPFETARERMSEMALSFWADNRRVDNTRIKKELGVTLSYPTYREGLAALAREF
jgi:nucleoside-diphosphate-sugar epimerase